MPKEANTAIFPKYNPVENLIKALICKHLPNVKSSQVRSWLKVCVGRHVMNAVQQHSDAAHFQDQIALKWIILYSTIGHAFEL